MKFHDIDSYNFDALGPMRVQRVTTATFPVFTALTDTGRVLYNTDTQKFYYGDNDSWVEFATYDSLLTHVNATTAHGSNGAVVGANTLSAHTGATAAHGSDGNVVGANTLSAHTGATTAHGSNGAVVGANTLSAHTGLTTTAHGGPYSPTSHGHNLATTGATGFMPILNNNVNTYLNGMGAWSSPTTPIIPGAGGWYYPGVRNSNVTYTNNNTRSIMVTVTAAHINQAATGSFSQTGIAYVNGVALQQSTQYTVVLSGYTVCLTWIVPPGSTYMFSSNLVSGSTSIGPLTIYKWFEIVL